MTRVTRTEEHEEIRQRTGTWKAGKTVLVLGIIFFGLGIILITPLALIAIFVLFPLTPILLVLGRKRVERVKVRSVVEKKEEEGEEEGV